MLLFWAGHFLRCVEEWLWQTQEGTKRDKEKGWTSPLSGLTWQLWWLWCPQAKWRCDPSEVHRIRVAAVLAHLPTVSQFSPLIAGTIFRLRVHLLLDILGWDLDFLRKEVVLLWLSHLLENGTSWEVSHFGSSLNCLLALQASTT